MLCQIFLQGVPGWLVAGVFTFQILSEICWSWLLSFETWEYSMRYPGKINENIPWNILQARPAGRELPSVCSNWFTSALLLSLWAHQVNIGVFICQSGNSPNKCVRHFWDAFPPTTPELAEKAKKMFETLQKFQSVKVRPFETEVERR